MIVRIFILSAVLACVAGTARAEQVVAESISLQQCIEQALANSLDLKIERIAPRLEHWAIIREWSAFEPVAQAQVNWSRINEPLDPEAAASTHTNILRQRRLTISPGLVGRLPTGGGYELSANNTRYSGDLVASNFLWTGTTALTLTQPLSRNFGFDANLAPLRIARKSRDIAVLGLTRKAIDVISDVSLAYYELVFAIENQKTSLGDLRSAEKLLADTRALVKAGMLSPIEATQAEAGAAARQETVILAESLIKQRMNILYILMGKDLDAAGDALMVPVDQPLSAPQEVDRAASIRHALELRPDYAQARCEVERRGIILKYSHWQLWPQIDLKASYGWTGRSFTFDGLADQITGADHPQWSVGVIFSMPLSDTRARADYASAKLEKERALLQLKRIEQVVVLDVANAVEQVRSGQQRITATAAARRLAEEALQAELKKLREGVSTSLAVLQAQTQLATAQTAELRARVSYQQSWIALDRAEGATLAKRGIVVDER